jgi:hypothetical protein
LSPYLYLAWDLLYFLNAILFALMVFQKRRTGWGGKPYSALIVACAVLYLDKIAIELTRALLHRDLAMLHLLRFAAELLIPPVLVHLVYHNERAALPGRAIWRVLLAAMYALGPVAAAMAVTGTAAGVRDAIAIGLMTAAGAFGAAMLVLSRRERTTRLDCHQNRWLAALCGILMCLCLLDVTIDPPWLGALVDTLPLCFLLVVTYYVERFTFFDILIKKGAFAFCSYVLLTLYFVFVPARLLPWTTRVLSHSWFGTFVWAASLCPLLLAAPWGHRKLSVWLDRLWLGRRFTPAEAAKHFLAGLKEATDSRELIEGASRHLSEIFQSSAEVRLGKAADEPVEGIRAPFYSAGQIAGGIVVRPRPHNVRFLSEDIALLASLAEIFSFLLENLRLREKRLAQEQRERELLLDAHRSELKALRAQVNPHFLFNALNTIAGLIPAQPESAEHTIEQLAEVFRYTLRRSDREWVRLEDELGAVRAYLDIEQARFRERLCVTVEAGDGAGNWRIPAMTLQTLVENAVKHGVAETAGPARVEIRAQIEGARLLVEVRDNGPGFSEKPRPAADQGGYGLRNVRERLHGHFGDDARLAIGRDAGMTVVRMEIPEVHG